jgi:hypothetical protein
MTVTTPGFNAQYSMRPILVSPSECDWDFGWDDFFSFLGIGVLHCGPLRIAVTWPPEDTWGDTFFLPLRVAHAAATGAVAVAIGLLADVAIRLKGP